MARRPRGKSSSAQSPHPGSGAESRLRPDPRLGPDPVVGASVALLGVLMMGIAGAATAHYAFNFGTLVALVGGAMFVGAMSIAAFKQRQKKKGKG